ncbi:hypothetical protein [Arthrobacter roseus]|uniref:hypothetical protein n=1 Tax=Arthrobacter roseus TaxID=136274 RepID=UPI0019660DB6|nr:hypothetical protein [Arthrobacter roseus]MBM7846880.1 glucan phosphoethanolaminetransferase (alkaline phosphatase superfamily) [Arthrobacter roseus]
MTAAAPDANDKKIAVGSGASTEVPRRYAGVVAPAAAWGFMFLVLRIMAVSGYDWNTAFLVSTTLSVSDSLALLVGTLMAGYLLVAILLIGVLPLLVATYLWSVRKHQAVMLLSIILSIVTLIALTTSFHLWWLPLATAAVFGTFALIRILPKESPVRRAFSRAMASVGWVAGIAVLLIAALVQTPWVPQEEIKTTNGTTLDTFSVSTRDF